MKFEEFGLSQPVMEAIAAQGYHTPTPIQAKAIPHALRGEDLLGSAETGTGKTAAFAIPIIHNLSGEGAPPKGHGRKIRALVVAPTRELASQILDSFQNYGKNTPLKFTAIYGGVSQFAQEKAIQRGVDIVVATPGRLCDLINQRIVNLSQVKILVLDEADRMLDMGFLPDIKRILSTMPEERQTLFFSATMPENVRGLADSMLRNPARVHIAPAKGATERIEQALFMVPQEQKTGFLVNFLAKDQVKSAVIFTRTRRGADRVVARLKKSKIHSEAIHSDKTQATRQRTLDSFRAGYLKFLVATDIAARGIDVDSVSHVINYDLPREPETYTHRIGRTGRAGASGKAVSFCDSTERGLLRQIERALGKRIPLETATFAPVIDEPADQDFRDEGNNDQGPPRGPRQYQSYSKKHSQQSSFGRSSYGRPRSQGDGAPRGERKSHGGGYSGGNGAPREEGRPQGERPAQGDRHPSGKPGNTGYKKPKNKSQKRKFNKFKPG